MKVYQFIKYDQKTEISHIKNYGDDRIIVCFDFEDGIQNSFDLEKTILLKKEHREYFVDIVNKFENEIKIGVRLNERDSVEFQKDIQKIKNINIYSIFLPKIETANEVIDIISELNYNKIIYKEIIPIIETKLGLQNSKSIVHECNIKNIAFGHCDYNLSLNILPFFNQESFEYWKWVYEIISNIETHNICFINSPYLSTNNIGFFSSMVEHLKMISNDNFGQITLTNSQTELCLTHTQPESEFNQLLSNRYELYPTKDYLNSVIYDYEKFNTGKGLSKCKHRIISVQEYIFSKKYKNRNNPIIRLAFVGGCFPVQHNIKHEDTFLYKTKLLVESEFNIELKTDIIRYERFANVLEKIKKIEHCKQFDFLIFSIRPEPFFRLIKFHYKFINNRGKLKYSFNLPLFKVVNPEKYDFLRLGRRFTYIQKSKESIFHNFLVDTNYFIGKLIGNKSFAIRKYIELIKEIQRFSNDNKIELILLGPNLRAKTTQEPKFCKELDKEVRNAFPETNYIDGLLEESDGKTVFQTNGVHVNKLYHELIAEKIYNVLKNKLRSPMHAITNAVMRDR